MVETIQYFIHSNEDSIQTWSHCMMDAIVVCRKLTIFTLPIRYNMPWTIAREVYTYFLYKIRKFCGGNGHIVFCMHCDLSRC